MECLLPIAFVGVGVFLVAALIGYSVWAAEKRKKKIREAAETLGLTFFEQGSQNYAAGLSKFDLFNAGRSRKISNVIHGETETEKVGIFDYRYTTGSGKNSNTHSQTVVSIQSPQLNLPSFSLCPENFFHKIASYFGYADINFDSHPEFSRRFLLRGPEEKAVRKLFTPKLLEYFEQRPGVTVEAVGNRLIFFRAGRLAQPERFVELMDEAYQVYGLLKS